MRELINLLHIEDKIEVVTVKEIEGSTERRENFVFTDKCISEIQFSGGIEKCDSVIWKDFYVSISKTTFKNIAEDSISYHFGGCLMARLRSKFDKTYRIAHIHCGRNTECVSFFCDYVTSSCKNEKTSFDELIIFKPLCVLDFKVLYETADKDYNFEVWGIIDNAGECFSVLVYKLNHYNECYVLCIAKHFNNHSVPLDKIGTISNKDLFEYVNNHITNLTFSLIAENRNTVEKELGHYI